MNRAKVLLTDYAWPDVEVERRVLEGAGLELVVAPSQQPEQLAQLAADAVAILTCWAPVTAQVIQATRRCRIIARLGIGLDNIDLQAARQRGIVVTNVPDYCVDEVAEHTLALVLALLRGVPHFHTETKAGRYHRECPWPLRRMRGMTLGVVGLGQIGTRVAQLAGALGMRVLGTSRSGKSVPGVDACSLEELLAQADVVSLHLPLTAQTHHLLNRRRLFSMKPRSYLVNTARGPLVDHAALSEALRCGHLAGAALDVQAEEPPRLEEPPYCLPQVIVTPHVAFASDRSVEELRRRASEEVVRVLSGQRPHHPVVECG